MTNSAPRFRLAPNCALLSAALLLGACGRPAAQDPPAPAQEPATQAATEPAIPVIPECQSTCGDSCSNVPYEPTNCLTTPYGPARANVVIGDPTSSTNMLWCDGGTYALCFFSGPPTATGTNSNNPVLACEVDGANANCTCQVYTSKPYYVDINSILNLGAYFETVDACLATGENCKSMATCGPYSGSPEACAALQTAPVCAYINGQNPDDDATSLIPGADVISAFSFAMDGDYQLSPHPPDCNGPYAGCMTAPCNFAEGAPQPPQDGDPITCVCPIWSGDFQVGQTGQSCVVPEGYVWSASRTVIPPPTSSGS